ncbi:MAG TPA: Uma2 family endonuclease [Pseudonocardia sp.]|jgi:Uma2 family endonuclease|uniref:Uma2 family endonuclease n=1 Tax=Pseudonocardia sp. TaxID=60912 RepID=UPI002F42D569
MTADPMVDLRKRFTVAEYELMGEVGVFDPADRVELLDGEIVYTSPISAGHAAVVDALVAVLVTNLAGRATVRGQNPLRLLPRSEPQPDVTVARYRRDFYRGAHPTAEDILLLIEVADSSLRTDRAVKLPIYARQGIVEVWLVDLAANAVHVHTEPDGDSYAEVHTVHLGEPLKPSAIPNLELRTADIFGE